MCGLGSCYVWSPPNARRNSRTFVHALNVFVSFTLFLSLYKKHCDSVKASWTKRRCSSSRRPASGRTRLGPASFQSHTSVEEASVDNSTAPENRW
ncbi:hypothetical protein MTP99_018429 [Tenebrio molitor]|nr:hypothetical protein MTP99_018429 [Tenebrio molitor]